MRRPLRALIEASLLGSVRRQWLVRHVPLRHLDLRLSIGLHLLVPAAFFLLFYLPPMLSINDATGPAVGRFAVAPSLSVNLSCVFFLYFGFFVGSYLVCGHMVIQNEGRLVYPLSLGGLARFRLWEVLKSAVTTAFFFVLPVISIGYLARGWSASAVALVLVSDLLAFLVFFLAGVVAMMTLLRRTGFRNPEGLFIAVFLTSTWLLVLALQLPRWPATEGLALSLRHGLDMFDTYGLAGVTARMATPVRLGGLALTLLLLVAALLVATEQVVTHSYRTIHRGLGDRLPETAAPVATPKVRRRPWPDYLALCRMLRPFKPPTRALLARDILFFTRNPLLLIKILSILVPLALLPFVGTLTFREPVVLDLYFFSAFLVVRLFLHSADLDGETAIFMRYAFASGVRYLRTRVVIAYEASLIFALPVWLSLGLVAGVGSAFTLVARTSLLLLNLLVATLLVVSYLIVVSGRQGGRATSTDSSSHQVMLIVLGLVGMSGPLFFYKLDLVLVGAAPDLGPLALASGLTAVGMTIGLVALAARKAPWRSDWLR